LNLKGFERWGRRVLQTPLKRLLLSGGPGRPPSSPERILVVRVDNRLGNLVMLTSLLNALREKFPSAVVSVLVSNVFHHILEGQGWKLIPVAKKTMAKRPWLLIGLVHRLRQQEFDVVIDASHPHGFSLSSAVITALAGCPHRVGSPLGAEPGWYTCSPSSMPGTDQHESRALHAVGAVWPGWPRWRPPRLALPREPRSRLIGIHPGAKGDKALPSGFLQELVGRLSGLAPVGVFWGNTQEEGIADALVQYGAVKMPPMNLPEFAQKVSGLGVFVCPDSGPMHVASAMGVPVVAVFQKDDARRFGPLSPWSVSLIRPEPDQVVRCVKALFG